MPRGTVNCAENN